MSALSSFAIGLRLLVFKLGFPRISVRRIGRDPIAAKCFGGFERRIRRAARGADQPPFLKAAVVADAEAVDRLDDLRPDDAATGLLFLKGAKLLAVEAACALFNGGALLGLHR